MQAKHPTTLRAIIVTCIWACSFIVFVYDLEVLFLTPMVVFNIGVIGFFVTPELGGEKITIKDGVVFISVVTLSVLAIILIFKVAPQLLEPPSQTYRIMGMAAMHLLCTLFLWWKWFKARQTITTDDPVSGA